MLQKLLLSGILSCMLFATANNTTKNNNTNKTQNNKATTQQSNVNDYYLRLKNLQNKNININSGSNGIIRDTRHHNIDTYIDTVIITDIESHKNKNSIQNASYAQVLNDNVAYQKKIAQSSQKPKQIKKHTVLNVKGYCKLINPVKVFSSDAFGEVNCDLTDMKTNANLHTKVFVKFMPDYKREMLIGFPIYATVNGKRLDSVGYFLNATKTSLNIASKVDSVRIKKLLLKGFLVESDIAYKQVTAYMSAIKASQTQTSITYIKDSNGNTTPVQSQQTAKPKARDYINTGIVNSVAALIKLFGEDSLYNLKPLFYINRGDIFYTEMILQDNNNLFSKFQSIMSSKTQQIQQDNNNYQQNLMNIK